MKIKLYNHIIHRVDKAELRDRFLEWCHRRPVQHLEAIGVAGALSEFIAREFQSIISNDDLNRLAGEFKIRFWNIVLRKPHYWTIYERK